ncbi:MAG: tRNA pseudouridine(38-40) synthase TruA [Actinomycetota bacterium]
MPTYRMVVVYDGAPFRGLARQPDERTVQGTIEEALSRVLRQDVRTVAAGRTDAGVHALGQVMSFQTDRAVDDLAGLARSLNALCGPAIAVAELQEAPDHFDARHSALSRTYEYAVLTREVHDPFSRHTTWHHPGTLDVEAMRKAASHLLGEHDFSSFGRVEQGQSPMRRLTSIEIEEAEHLVVIRVTANAFIQQMVRSIVGTLIRVGEGRIDPDEVETILHSRDRASAGPVAPPHGLFLVAVAYPADEVK